MNKIWKYQVPWKGSLEISKGGKILFVGQQNGATIWVLVDPTAETETRTFKIIATGEPFDATGMVYLGTVFEGVFVCHVFETGR